MGCVSRRFRCACSALTVQLLHAMGCPAVQLAVETRITAGGRYGTAMSSVNDTTIILAPGQGRVRKGEVHARTPRSAASRTPAMRTNTSGSLRRHVSWVTGTTTPTYHPWETKGRPSTVTLVPVSLCLRSLCNLHAGPCVRLGVRWHHLARNDNPGAVGLCDSSHTVRSASVRGVAHAGTNHL